MKSASSAVADCVAGRDVLRGCLGPGHRVDYGHGEGLLPAPRLPAPPSWSPVPTTASTASTATNSAGDYNESALPGGTYDVIVTATGFKKYQAKGVILDVAQKARVDVTLRGRCRSAPKSWCEGANVAQVETQSSELAGTVTGKEITQLELNGRNFTQLVTLTPGVSNQTGQDEGTVGVNGNVSASA